MVEIVTYINGLSSLVIFSFGIALGVYFLISYSKEKKSLKPFIALMMFCVGSFYLGGSVSIISILVSGQSISILTAGFLSYSSVPIGIVLGMFVGYSIFNPERRKSVSFIYGFTGIVYYIALFAFPTLMIGGTEPQLGEITDTNLRSVVLYLSIFYILSVIFVLSLQFYRLSKKLQGGENQKYGQKTYLLFWAWVLFSISQIVEIVATGYLIFIPRVITLISFALMYKGFS